MGLDSLLQEMAAATKALKFGPAIKEIRLHLCQKSAASTGAREFVEKYYVPMKTANPGHPILIRECSGIQPRVWARFTYGREESVDLSNKNSKDFWISLASFNNNNLCFV